MNKIRAICIVTSICIHTSAIGIFSGSSWLEKVLIPIKKQDFDRLALQFVDSPEVFDEKKIDKKINDISDKALTAKDELKEEKEVEDKTKTKENDVVKQLAKRSSLRQKSIPYNEEKKEKKDLLKESNRLEKKPEYKESVEQKEDKALDSMASDNSLDDDMISIPEITEDLVSAKSKGTVTFETSYHEIGPYFKDVKKKIEHYWLGYLLFKYPNMKPEESSATVSFKILPTGDVSNLEIVDYNGDIIFKDFCIATISNTAPYDPLPEGIKEVEKEGGINIVFTFRYR